MQIIPVDVCKVSFFLSCCQIQPARSVPVAHDQTSVLERSSRRVAVDNLRQHKRQEALREEGWDLGRQWLERISGLTRTSPSRGR